MIECSLQTAYRTWMYSIHLQGLNPVTHLLTQPSSAPASTREYSKASPGKASGIEGHCFPGSPQTTQQHQPRSSPASPTRQVTRPWSYVGEEERKISKGARKCACTVRSMCAKVFTLQKVCTYTKVCEDVKRISKVLSF